MLPPGVYARIASHITHAAAGLYAWELAISLPCDVGVVLALFWPPSSSSLSNSNTTNLKGSTPNPTSYAKSAGLPRSSNVTIPLPVTPSTSPNPNLRPNAHRNSDPNSTNNLGTNTSSSNSTPKLDTLARLAHALLRLSTLLALVSYLALFNLDLSFLQDVSLAPSPEVGSASGAAAVCVSAWERDVVRVLAVCASVTTTASLALSSLFILLRALTLTSLLPANVCSNLIFTIPLCLIYALMWIGVGVVGAVSGGSYRHLSTFDGGGVKGCGVVSVVMIVDREGVGAGGGGDGDGGVGSTVVGFLAYTLIFDVLLTVLSMVAIRSATMRKEKEKQRQNLRVKEEAEALTRFDSSGWGYGPGSGSGSGSGSGLVRGCSRHEGGPRESPCTVDTDSECEKDEEQEGIMLTEFPAHRRSRTKTHKRTQKRSCSHSRSRHRHVSDITSPLDCTSPNDIAPPVPSLPQAFARDRNHVAAASDRPTIAKDTTNRSVGSDRDYEAHIQTSPFALAHDRWQRHPSVTSSAGASSSTAASVGYGDSGAEPSRYRDTGICRSAYNDMEQDSKESVYSDDVKESDADGGYDKFMNEEYAWDKNDGAASEDGEVGADRTEVARGRVRGGEGRRDEAGEYVEMRRWSAAEPDAVDRHRARLYERPRLPSTTSRSRSRRRTALRAVEREMHPFPSIPGAYTHLKRLSASCNPSSEVSLPALTSASYPPYHSRIPRSAPPTCTSGYPPRPPESPSYAHPHHYLPPRPSLSHLPNTPHLQFAPHPKLPPLPRNRFPPRTNAGSLPSVKGPAPVSRESPCVRALKSQRVACFGWIVIGKVAMVVCAGLAGSGFNDAAFEIPSVILGRGSFLDPSMICICVPALIFITIAAGRLFIGITLSSGSQFGEGFIVRDPPYPPLLTLTSVPFPSPSTLHRRGRGRWRWTEEDIEDAVVLGAVQSNRHVVGENSTANLIEEGERRYGEERGNADHVRRRVLRPFSRDPSHSRYPSFPLAFPLPPVLPLRSRRSHPNSTSIQPQSSRPLQPTKHKSLNRTRTRFKSLTEPPLPRPPPLVSWRALRHEDDPERKVIPSYVNRERYVRRVWDERYGYRDRYCDCHDHDHNCDSDKGARGTGHVETLSAGLVRHGASNGWDEGEDVGSGGCGRKTRRAMYGGGGRVGGWTAEGVRAKEVREGRRREERRLEKQKLERQQEREQVYGSGGDGGGGSS